MPPAPRRLSLPQALRSPAAAFLAALLIRVGVLALGANSTELLPEQGDMKFYSDWARRIAGGALTDHQAFYGLPGYAYWLALVYSVVGYQPYVAALLQAVAEGLTASFIFRLAPLAFAREGDAADARRAVGIGWAAALGWAFFVPAQVYSSVLMPTCYLVCAFWFVVWWTLRRRTGPPPARAFLGLGLLMGAVAMMVANILLLLPLVVGGICLQREWAVPGAGPWRAGRARALAAAALLAGAGLGVLPCALHNYLLAGEPVLLSAHAGINAFIGNNPEANGYPHIPAPLHTDQQGMLKDSILWAERAEGHPLRRAEVSTFWSGLARRFMHEQPGAWLRLEAVKLGCFWNGFEYDDLGVLTPFREEGIRLPGPHWALVALLALPGLALAAARQPRSRWIIAAVALHMGSVLTVFVTERYRLAAVPGLLLLGAYGVAEAWRAAAARQWRPVAAYALVMALAAAVIFRPVDASLLTVDDYNSALADLEHGRTDRARAKLERVLRLTPTAETYFALGNVALAQNDVPRAKEMYRETLRIDPQHGRVLNNLGVLALREKCWPLAEAFLSGSLQIDAADAKTHYLLAQARFEQHNPGGAHAELAEALRLRPAEPMFLELGDRMAKANDQ